MTFIQAVGRLGYHFATKHMSDLARKPPPPAPAALVSHVRLVSDLEPNA